MVISGYLDGAIPLSHRDRILERLAEIIGFPINESEISPAHRLEISSLAQASEECEIRMEYATAAFAKASNDSLYMFGSFLSGIVIFSIPFILDFAAGSWRPRPPPPPSGIMMGFVFFGLFVMIAGGYLFNRSSTNNKAKGEDLINQASKLEEEIKQRIEGLALSVKEHLSKVDRVRTTTPIHLDIGQLLDALKEKGVILETIECPNCKGMLEISKLPKNEEIFKCKHCNKPILVVNIFERFKEILGL